MKSLHLPTFLAAVVVALALVGLYHLTLGRKG